MTAGAAPRRLYGTLRRLRLWQLIVIVVTVAVVVSGIVISQRSGTSLPATSSAGSQPAGAGDNRSLLDVVSKVDPRVAAAVGAGGVAAPFSPIAGTPPLTGAAGRPQVLFVAGETCGLCAAQRWSMVVALSRFGSMHNVLLGASSANDPYPGLASFSFRSLSYTSPYVDLVAVETTDEQGRPQQTLTADQQQLLTRYDGPPYVTALPAGTLPWLDVANRQAMAGSGYAPTVLKGLAWGQIAPRLATATDPVTMAIVGEANWITAAICTATGMQPANVCGTAPVNALVAQLH